MPLLNESDDIKYGSSQVEQVLLGNDVIWAALPYAEGGSVEEKTIGGVLYRIHTFNSTGTFNVIRPGLNATAEYIIVAGGGGGGFFDDGNEGGGGGAGGFRSSVVGAPSGGGASAEPVVNLTKGTFPVIVGAGGASTINGEDSSVFGITAIGGGKGGRGRGFYSLGTNGQDGGSGGGGAQTDAPTSGGSGTAGQGYNGGGNPVGEAYSRQASGGGAGGPGLNAQASDGFNRGGYGVNSSIDGTATLYAQGGPNQTTIAEVNRGWGGRGSEDPGGERPGSSGRVVIRYRIE